jgi:hypothetical protein
MRKVPCVELRPNRPASVAIRSTTLAASGRYPLIQHALVVFACTMCWTAIGEPRVVFGVAGACALLGFGWLSIAEAKKAPLLITPVSSYLAMLSLSLGLSPMVVSLLRPASSPFIFLTAIVGPEDVLLGYILCLYGSLALHAGLRTIRSDFRRDGYKREQSISGLVTVWAAGLATSIAGSATSQLGMLGGFFQYGALAATCSLAVNPPAEFKPGKGLYWPALYIGTLTTLICHIRMGLKFFIMLSILPIFWALLVSGRKIGRIMALLACSALIYIAVVEPVISASRTQFKDPTQTVEQSIRTAFHKQDLTSASLPDWSATICRTADRMFPAIPVGYFVWNVRTRGPQNGATLEYLRYAFIPRLFWEDKPNVSRGAWLTYYLGFSISESASRTATALTPVGELYWNFQTPGVLMGMFILGVLYSGLMWRPTANNPAASPLHMLLYINLLVLVTGEAEAGSALVAILGYSAIFFVLRLLGTALSHPSKGVGDPASRRKSRSMTWRNAAAVAAQEARYQDGSAFPAQR